jgi:cytoskeletal protein CcmA (bactofilin family)
MVVRSEAKKEEGAERVTIAGSGRISGGTYQSIKVAGSGTIAGDVKAESISIAGSCAIEGNAEAEEFHSAGSCRVDGNVKAEDLRTTGSAVVNGDVSADVFKCSGTQKIGGKLTTSYIKISGTCVVGGDVEADKFNSEGSFEIGGLLSADEISIRLGGDSHAREIGGEKIEVLQKFGSFDQDKFKRRMEEKTKGKRWKFNDFGVNIDVDLEKITDMMGQLKESLGNFGIHVSGFIGAGVLEAETIEGDEIHLESTKAKTVRGKNVVIGLGCEIERVEYEESLEVNELSHVETREKI